MRSHRMRTPCSCKNATSIIYVICDFMHTVGAQPWIHESNLVDATSTRCESVPHSHFCTTSILPLLSMFSIWMLAVMSVHMRATLHAPKNNHPNLSDNIAMLTRCKPHNLVSTFRSTKCTHASTTPLGPATKPRHVGVLSRELSEFTRVVLLSATWGWHCKV